MEQPINSQPIPPVEPPKTNWVKKPVVIASLVVIFIGAVAAVYWVGNKKNSTPNTNTLNQTQQNQDTIQQNNSGAIKGIVYKPVSQGKTTDEIHYKNLQTGEDTIISSSAIEGSLSFDKKSVYTANTSGNTLEVSKYNLADKSNKVIFNKNLGYKIASVQLFSAKDNSLWFNVSLEDQANASKDVYEKTYFEQLFQYDEIKNTANKVYEETADMFSGSTILAVNGNDIYLSASGFESPSSLVKLNLSTKKSENISNSQKFSFTHTTVSPNQRYIAMSTLHYIGNDQNTIENSLSFYDIVAQKLTHSQLKTAASGEFPGGLSGFRYITWDSNSTFVYAEVDKPIGGQGLGSQYYFVKLDGTANEQTKLKELKDEVEIRQVIDNKTALVAKIVSRQATSLNLFDLDSYQVKSVVLPSLSGDIYTFKQAFIGIVE